MTRKLERRVVRAAMRLYRHWAKGVDTTFWPEGFWYPLGSEKQAVPFGKACAVLRRAKQRRGK